MPASPGLVTMATAANDQDGDRRSQHRKHRHLDVEGFDFLAEIFGSAADHQAGDEDGEDDEDKHAVKSGADPAEDDLAKHDIEKRDHAAEGREGIVHAVDGTAASVRCDRREKGAVGYSEANFLAFHVPAGL